MDEKGMTDENALIQFDLFSKDLVMFPINIGNMHWTAGIIDLKNKRVEYFDSMGTGGREEEVFDVVMDYLSAEWKDKGHPGEFPTSEWTVRIDETAPKQDNGSDCGVFSCQTLEAASRGLDPGSGKWEFTCTNMEFMRKMMIWEIAKGTLYTRW